MINESKRNDPRSWEKWEKAGAISTPPQVIERREGEAEKWLAEQYNFDPSRLSKESEQKLFQDVQGSYAKYKEGLNTKEDVLEKIKAHPVLTVEEVASQKHQEFGTTNNFWNTFFPETRAAIKKNLEEGKLPTDFRSKQIVFWQMKNILMPAFGRVGFDRIKRMHDALEMYVTLDRE